MLCPNRWALGVLLFCLALYRSDGASCGLPREYGGESIAYYFQSDKSPFPWTVAITNNFRQFKCIGSIVAEGYGSNAQNNGSSLILTAGSCFRCQLFKRWGSPSSYRVFAGIERYRLFGIGATKRYVKKIRILPFNTGNDYMWYGVALVTLSKPFVFNRHISPICISNDLVPPDPKRCFVSTYVSSRLDEEAVNLVPGSLCDFGHFPELKNVGGICSIHKHSYTEKSFGGPLTCVVSDRAIQFGIYLSQMDVEETFRKAMALHYYGHFSKLLSKDPLHEKDFIEMDTKSSTDSKSPGTVEAETQEPTGSMQGRQPRCGDTSFFHRTLESYIEGETSKEIFPWNVFIATRMRGLVRCIGSLIHTGGMESSANVSEVVLTAAGCFRRYSYSSWLAKTNLVVYAGTSNYAWYSRKGIKVTIQTTRSYGILEKSGERRNEVALLRLRKPLTTRQKVMPVCLAPREELPPFDALCYVTRYDRKDHRVDEEPLVLTTERRCPSEDSERGSFSPGLCTIEDPPKHHVQLGAPLVCIVKGRAYQYGVYLKQLSLEINSRASQKLGYYTGISIVHGILHGENPDQSKGEKVIRLPEEVRPAEEVTHPGGKTETRRPIWPVIQPIPETTVTLPETPGDESVSASSGWQEVPEKQEPSKPLDFPYQILPSPTGSLNQVAVYPLAPPVKEDVKSPSASMASKSKSSSSEQSVEEIALPEEPMPEADSPVLKRNETVIIVRFPELKYPRFVIRKEITEEPVTVLPPDSSESVENEFPTDAPVPVATPYPGTAWRIPSAPPLVETVSLPGSPGHSRSTSASHSSSASVSDESMHSGIEEIPASPGSPVEEISYPAFPEVSVTPAPVPVFPTPSVKPAPAPASPHSIAPSPIPVFPSRPIKPSPFPASPAPNAKPSLIPVFPSKSAKPAAIPSFPSKSACVFPNRGSSSQRPNDISICSKQLNGKGGSGNTVPLPSPSPYPGRPGTSIVSAERIVVAFPHQYDISQRPNSVHEHILVDDNYATGGSTAAGIYGAYSGSIERTSERSSWSYLGGNSPAYVGGTITRRLPGAAAVHIFDSSGKSPNKACSGILVVRQGQQYADEVVTAARCIWSQGPKSYSVYIGSLQPERMTETNLHRSVIPVEDIKSLPLYAGTLTLKAIGAAVLKLKNKVRVNLGVQSFPFAYPGTGPTPQTRCFVSGVCKHGLPVRVQYQLLHPSDCRTRLGPPYLPSLYYCGIGRKDILEFPSGAPLICDFYGTWLQFGIYDHAPRSARLDHFGFAEEQNVNEVAIFLRVNGTSIGGRKVSLA